MKKIQYISKISIVLLYILLSTGCYTMINRPGDNSHSQDQTSEADSNGDYTVINNYSCSSETTCCNHDYCHTNINTTHYHNCSGHCSLSYNWWTSTWVSYSCNYCHHWSCSGHHHGHFYGHGYFYHDHHHHGYNYGYHDGYNDGYWWGYNDGTDDDGYDNGHDDYVDDRVERRDNSFNHGQEDNDNTDGQEDFEEEDVASNTISTSDRALDTQPAIISASDPNGDYNKKRDRQKNSNKSSKIELESNNKKEIVQETTKRSSIAIDLAKILFSSISKSKGSKSKKSSSSKSKGTKEKDSSNDNSSVNKDKKSSKNNKRSKESTSSEYRRY